jgi:uncharacterized Zn finger protein
MSTSETLPRLTEKQVRELATPQSFDRGKQYYRSGSIMNPTRQGSTLWADCEGSETYRVRAMLSKAGVQTSSCTCPYDWGGICKHEVALLLTYVHQPETFFALPPLKEKLASRSHDELVNLIEQMVERHPELSSLVELSTPIKQGQPIDLSTFRRQVQRTLKRQEPEEIIDVLEALEDKAAQLFSAGDWLNAGALYQMVLNELTANYDYEMREIDYDGDINILAQEFVESLGKCLAVAQSLDPITRAAWLTTLLEAGFQDIELGGIDYAAGATDVLLEWATDEEWDWLEQRIRDEIAQHDRWAKEALVRILVARREQTGRTDEANALIYEIGTPEQRAFLLVQEGKLDEAEAIVRQNFTHLPGLVTNFADALLAVDPDRAFRFMTEQQEKGTYRGYQNWFTKYYEQHSDPQTALNWHHQLFQQQPSLPEYLRLRTIAQQTKTWKSLRTEILKELEQSERFDILLQIALEEKEIDNLLPLFQKQPNHARFSYTLKVAEAIQQKYPQEAIELYLPLVQRAIDQRSRSTYQEAARYLKQIKALYQSMKALPQWQTYIQKIRTQYPTLRALQDELNKAGL